MTGTSVFVLLCACALAACSSKPNPPRPSVPRSSAPAKPVRITHISQEQAAGELMLHGMDLIGTPYRWGGTDDSGFDCSGLVHFVYQRALQVSLPRTSRDMAAASRNVPQAQLQAGDLVFFNTSGRGISHVGIYIGSQRFLHAPRTGSSVQIERLDKPYYAQRFVRGGRLF